MQEPSPRDGIRRARIVCLARTYGDIWDKVLPSYKKTYPAAIFGEVEGSKNRQANHHYQIREPGKGILDVEVWFRAVQDIDLEDFVRGMECTAWWLTEMDTLPQAIVELAAQRVGRYPEPDHRPEPVEGESERPLAYAGVFGDANVPDIDDWFYNQFWLSANRPDHWHLFLQPAAILAKGPPWLQNPDAENLLNLRKADPNWYATQAKDMQTWQIRRFLQCKPGYSRHATPVHEDFDDVDHVATARLTIDPYKPIIIGADGGGGTLHPSAAFMQNPSPLSWRVHAEFAPQERCGVEEFARNIKRILNTEVKRAAGAVIIGDPAMAQGMTFGAEESGGGFSIQSYGQKLQALTGIEVILAPTNDPAQRREGLTTVLRQRGGFIIDPRCKYLIRSLAGGFRYPKRAGEKNMPNLSPVKNMHSHIAEGCEYGVLGGEGMAGFFGGLGGDHGVSADLMPQPIM